MINALPLNHAHPKNSFSTNQQQYRVSHDYSEVATVSPGRKRIIKDKNITKKKRIYLTVTPYSTTTALPKRSKIKKILELFT